jgi:hypothetical protein
MLFVGSAVNNLPLSPCFLFVSLCFSGEARFLVLSRFLQPACLFYITLSLLCAIYKINTKRRSFWDWDELKLKLKFLVCALYTPGARHPGC